KIDGVLGFRSKVRLTDITDGTSNTFIVGERPPSADMYWGWWFAGAGYDWSGRGDVVLGPRDYGYAAAMTTRGSPGIPCNQAYPPNGKVGFQPGRIQDNCDQSHFWSLHIGGANWLRGDGSMKFVSYTVDSPADPTSNFTALCTRNGGEVIREY